ncbi:MAG: hypothetical protein EZS28_036724, partial [Streblomastix strix]
MTRALMDTTEQGNLLKTQPSPVIRPGYNNLMMRSLGSLSQTEDVHPASADTLLIKIVGFTGDLDQELKKPIAQQVIDLIRSKPEVIPPEWAQDLVKNTKLETQQTAFLPLLSQLQQLNMSPYAPLNNFYNQPPQQQSQCQQSLQYAFHQFGYPMQYPVQPTQFHVIPLLSPFLPTLSQPQTISELRLPSNENAIDQQCSIQPSQYVEQAAILTNKRPRLNITTTRSEYNQLIPPIS